MKILVAEGYADERIRILPPELLEAVSAKGTWEKYSAIHGGALANLARRREEEVLAVVGMLDEALKRKKAIVVAYPPRGIGYDSGRGGYLNAVAYLAHELGAAVISLDVHFPWGTWDLHVRLGFPFVAIYSGAEGPPPGKLARKSDKIVAVPLPPGASDRSIIPALKLIERLGGIPLVLEVGLDLYRLEPLGYFFATTNAYYEAGKLVEGGGYIVLDCVSSKSINALRALLSGAEGGDNPSPEEPQEENTAVRREVDKVLRKAGERILKIVKSN